MLEIMDDISQTFTKDSILNKFNAVRKQSLKLIKPLEAEDMVIQTESFVSPIKWHLGHTTWFFEKFLLIPNLKNYRLFDQSFDYIFNSYYLGIGSFNERSKRGFLNRPLYQRVLEYRKYVDSHINDLLNYKLSQDLNFKVELGINHEQQHQELILMDIKHIFFSNPLKPIFLENKKNHKKKEVRYSNEFKCDENTKFKFGNNAENFCYDNESPSSFCYLQPFRLDNFVTNKDWKEFMSEGGYENFKYWLSDGWDFIQKNKIRKPMYWVDSNNYFTFYGVKKILDQLPVSNISYYEAQAFANYKKKRLPTEFEMEFVLSSSKKNGNFLEQANFEEINYNTKLFKMSFYGNLWVWTSSYYVPYKNYKPFKNNLSEYNSKFMCNQLVLKGGSFASPKSHIRSSYRNFYYPGDRWQFSGLRLAEDI